MKTICFLSQTGEATFGQLLDKLRLLFSTTGHTGSNQPRPENIHHGKKYHSMADLLFNCSRIRPKFVVKIIPGKQHN